jgi:hypothetical protein
MKFIYKKAYLSCPKSQENRTWKYQLQRQRLWHSKIKSPTAKTVINDKAVEQVNMFKYLEYNINLNDLNDFNMKLSISQYVCGTIWRMLGDRARTEILLELYKIITLPTLIFGPECHNLSRQLKSWNEAPEDCFRPYEKSHTQTITKI